MSEKNDEDVNTLSSLYKLIPGKWKMKEYSF